MLEASAPDRIGGQPGAYNQHSGRMHDGIERLILIDPRMGSEGSIEAFGNVLDGDFVGQRLVVADRKLLDRIAALPQGVAPNPKRLPLVRVAVDQHHWIACHRALALWSETPCGSDFNLIPVFRGPKVAR